MEESAESTDTLQALASAVALVAPRSPVAWPELSDNRGHLHHVLERSRARGLEPQTRLLFVPRCQFREHYHQLPSLEKPSRATSTRERLVKKWAATSGAKCPGLEAHRHLGPHREVIESPGSLHLGQGEMLESSLTPGRS